jgi:hypothetical protein
MASALYLAAAFSNLLGLLFYRPLCIFSNFYYLGLWLIAKFCSMLFFISELSPILTL